MALFGFRHIVIVPERHDDIVRGHRRSVVLLTSRISLAQILFFLLILQKNSKYK